MVEFSRGVNDMSRAKMDIFRPLGEASAYKSRWQGVGGRGRRPPATHLHENSPANGGAVPWTATRPLPDTER